MSTAGAVRPRRIPALDVLRGLAIVGVTADHLLAACALRDALPYWLHLPVSTLLRVATPLFFFVFGFLLEVVYCRPERQGVTRRLLIRSAQCATGYAAICLAPLLVGLWDWSQAWRAVAGFGGSRYGDVLKFYALALVVAAGVVALRRRHGSLVWSAVLVAALSAFILSDQVPAADQAGWRHWQAVLTGWPGGESYFSLWHGWTVVASGAICGLAANRWRDDPERILLRRRCLAVWAAACLVVLAILASKGLPAVRQDLSGEQGGRTAHSLLYYSCGVAAASFAVAIGIWFTRRYSAIADRWGRPFVLIGRHSLLIFAGTNAVLAAFPYDIDALGVAWRWLIALASLALFAAGLWWLRLYERKDASA